MKEVKYEGYILYNGLGEVVLMRVFWIRWVFEYKRDVKFEFLVKKDKGDLDKDGSLSGKVCGISGVFVEMLKEVFLYFIILI